MKRYEYGNAVIVVHRPELPPEDQKKREGQILTTLQQFGKAMQDAEKAVSA